MLDSFQSFPSVESTASPTDLGSSSMVGNTNVEWKLGGIYLSTIFLTRSKLLTNGVGCSTSSFDSVDSSESSSSFLSSNHTFSRLFYV
jgi:hypothetical protein